MADVVVLARESEIAEKDRWLVVFGQISGKMSKLVADSILRFGNWWEPNWFNLAPSGWADLLSLV